MYNNKDMKGPDFVFEIRRKKVTRVTLTHSKALEDLGELADAN